MRYSEAAILVVFTLTVQADPREQVGKYPTHAGVRDYELGAEYMGRAFFVEGKAYDSGDFIAVEIGVFPRKGKSVKIMASQFALRFNGKKELTYAQTPGAVAVALRMQPWDENRRGVVVTAGPAVVGAPYPTGRFPGDPGARRTEPPRAPEPEHESKVEKPPAPTYGELVEQAAFVDRTVEKPAGGYLFFPYAGKLTKLKKIELVVVDEDNRGSIVLK